MLGSPDGWILGYSDGLLAPLFLALHTQSLNLQPTPRPPQTATGGLWVYFRWRARCQETTCRNASNKEFDFAGRSVGLSPPNPPIPLWFSLGSPLECVPSPRLMARCMFYHAWWHEWARAPDKKKERETAKVGLTSLSSFLFIFFF